MTAITASEARANLYRLIDEAASSHQPLLTLEPLRIVPANSQPGASSDPATADVPAR